MFKLGINNFRSFKNEEFNFSRINILIGENSSGKSSLLKFLLAAKQSLSGANNRNINFSFRGENADLGSYKESIYYNNDDLELSFKFTFDSKYFNFFVKFITADEAKKGSPESLEKARENIIKRFGNETLEETSAYFQLSKELSKHESITTEFFNQGIGRLSIKPDDNTKDDSSKLFESPTCNIEYQDFSTNTTLHLENIEYQPQGFLTLLFGISLRSAIAKLLYTLNSESGNLPDNLITEKDNIIENKIDTIFYKIAFLIVTQNCIQSRLSKIDFINPIDTKPSRVFLNSDEVNNPSIRNIDDVVDFLSRDNRISQIALNGLNEVIKRFGIAEKIEIIQDTRLPVKELKVQIKDLLSNIMDVGYGVVLQLPILLKALLAESLPSRRDSVIIIEQPEVHLHPKLHASFLEALLSLGDKNTYFIETHSEHIIRKLQILVKDETFGIKSNEVSINYLIRKEKESIKTEHRIQNNGFLEPSFPSGFFDNSYLLSLNLLK